LIASGGIKARLIVFYNNLRSTPSPYLPHFSGMKKNKDRKDAVRIPRVERGIEQTDGGDQEKN
jgi:hypothetical protein